MARKYLSRSLDNLFNEIDSRWPKRDRRTDGWYATDRESVGHNPGHRGLVHAIDVDDDGIDEVWIIRNIYKGGDVLRYIIWNRHIYHRRDGWKARPYTGKSPHTDHMHIEINQTTAAEDYNGHWGIASGGSGFGSASSGGGVGSIGGLVQDIYSSAMNEGDRDYKHHVLNLAGWFGTLGTSTQGAGGTLRKLRRI